MAMICHVQIARVSQMEVLAWIRAVNVVVTAHLALREVKRINAFFLYLKKKKKILICKKKNLPQ